MAEIVGWFSLKGGAHIPIMKGQSRAEAAKKYYASKHGKTVAKLSSKKYTNKSDSNDTSFTSKMKKEDIAKKYNINQWEQSTINDYTGVNYSNINSQLRENFGDISKCSIDVKNNCEGLDSAISKLPKYEGSVCRKEPDSIIAKYIEGRTYTNYGYTSTTAWSDVGGNSKLIIKQSSGANISKFSRNPGENEVLLPRGFKYKITKIEKNESGYMNIYAEEV